MIIERYESYKLLEIVGTSSPILYMCPIIDFRINSALFYSFRDSEVPDNWSLVNKIIASKNPPW